MPSRTVARDAPGPAGPSAAASSLRQILLNGSALLAAYVLPRLLTFAAALVAARLLGPAAFGDYGTAASFTMILSILATLGMLPLLVRELARAPARAPSIIGAAHRIKMVASVVMIAAVFILSSFVLDYPPHVVQATVLLAVGHAFLAFGENLGAWFQAEERMHIWLEANLAFGVISGLIGILLVVWTRSVPLFAAAFAAGQLAALLWLLRRLPAGMRGSSHTSRNEFRSLLRETAPFALAFLALTLFYKIDVLLVQRLHDPAAVGIYAAGYKLVDVVHALAVVAAAALYPRLSRTASGTARAYASQRSLELFLLAGAFGSSLLWLLRAPITQLLFGAEYADTTVVLGWLAPSLIVLVLNILAGYLLSAANRITPLAVSYLGACSLKLLLAVWWIPEHGAEGMARAALVAEVCLAFALLVGLARAGAGAPSLRPVVLSMFAAGVAPLIALLAVPLSPPVTAVAYLLVVAIVYGRGHALTRAEWQLLGSAIRGKGRGETAREAVTA